MKMNTYRQLTSCFGLGRMPIAPGTWGSIPPVLLFLFLNYFDLPKYIIALVMLFFVIDFSLITALLSRQAVIATGSKDPSEVVSDEFAGQSLTLFFVAMYPYSNGFIAAGLAFLLFRFFDITKMWPANKLETVSGGWGILLDDLMAGLYAAFILMLVYCVSGSFSDGPGGAIGVLPAAMLGVIQGLTEFLPVSSSGHLVLAEHFLPNIDPDSSDMLVFDLAIHLATVLAIFAVYKNAFLEMIKNLFDTAKYGKGPIEIYKKSPSVHLIVLAVITTVTTGVGYVLFKEPLESARKLELVGFMWILTATLLLVTDKKVKARLSLRKFSIFAAVIIGVAQTVAILPGISRSGSTICAAILLGLHRKWAVQYSFLIAIPAIVAGAGLKFLEEYQSIISGAIPVASLIVGMSGAFIVGYVSLKLLIKYSRKRKLKWFAYYCYAMAAFALIYSIISNG